jgi:O-antigen ligase
MDDSALSIVTVSLVLWLGGALAPDGFKALAVLLVAALTLPVLLAFGARRLPTAVAVGASLVVLALAVSTMTAPQPRVALMGVAYQHTGMAFLVLSLAAFLVGLTLSESRAWVVPFLVALMSLGLLTSLGYILDALAILPHDPRYSPTASGFFENPASLAQFLLLALTATVTLLLIARDNFPAFATLLASVALQVYVLASTSLLAVYAALIAAAAIMAVLSFLPRGRAWAVGGIVVVTSLAPFLLAPFYSVDFLRDASNYRFDSWKAAMQRILERPLVGWGGDMFTALFGVDVEGGALVHTQTADPHNYLLLLILAGGLVGVAAVILMVVLGLRNMAPAFAIEVDALTRNMATALLFCIPVFWAFSWPNPIVVLLWALALPGLLLRCTGCTGRSGSRRVLGFGVVVIVAIAAILALGLSLPLVRVETAGADLGPERLLEAYEQTGDPTFYDRYAADAIEAYRLGRMSDQEFVRFRTRLTSLAWDDGRWFADLPLLAGISLNTRVDGQLSSDDDFSRTLDAGRAADSNTFVWDLLALVRARSSGNQREVQEAGRRLMEREDLPAGTRDFVSALLRESG